MGSCISKCATNPSPPQAPPLPQDKLVISQSPVNPTTNPLHNLPITKPPSFSSSSSSSLSSSKTSNHSYSSASSSSKDGSFSNEFLMSCARKNPSIVVLDPHYRHSFVKPVDTAKIPAHKFQSPAKVPPNPALPVKRPRSNSPPAFARQKSFRSGLSTAPVLHPPANRAVASPTARPRCSGDVPGRQQQHMRMNGVSPSNVAVALPLAARKEKLRFPSPCNPTRSSKEKEVATLRQIHPVDTKVGLILNQRREVPIDLCHEDPEDIDNPLISMDCFIFL